MKLNLYLGLLCCVRPILAGTIVCVNERTLAWLTVKLLIAHVCDNTVWAVIRLDCSPAVLTGINGYALSVPAYKGAAINNDIRYL